MAAQIYFNVDSPDIIEQLFKYKTQIFTAPFAQLNAQILLDNLQAYRIKSNEVRRQRIAELKDRIETLYIDDKLKPERL